MKIILIEDDPNDELFIRREIKQHFDAEITVAATWADVEKIHLSIFDVIISDYMLDGFTAIKVVDLIKSLEVQTPLIILSGRIGEETAVEAMKAGAWDYVMKDKMSLLAPAIKRALELKEKKKQAEETMLKLIQMKTIETTTLLSMGAVHDLNNILNAFHHNLEMMQAKIENKDLHDIEKNVLNLRLALNKGIEFSRTLLDTYKNQNLHSENKPRINPNHSINRIMPLLNMIVGTKIEIVASDNSTDCEIIIANSSFDQIVLNIVKNAQDAMPEGGKLSIRSQIQTIGENPYFILKISDTGKGIEPQNLLKVFNPFYTTKNNKGTGLGLPLLKKIVTDNEGQIKIESELNRGTEVTISFPAQSPLKVEQEKIETEFTSRKHNILLIDDEEMLVESLEYILKIHGHKVKCLTRAPESLEGISDFDRIMIDINLAGENGIKLAKKNQRISHEGEHCPAFWTFNF